MGISPAKPLAAEPHLEVVDDATPPQGLPLPSHVELQVAADPSPPTAAPPREQVRPFMDLYQPTWLHPVIRLLLLDENGHMPRTVQAQVGFGAMLMGVQFCMDLLAWILGFRWVFVNAMGWPGWFLAFLFAFLVSSIILIFERFVLTADVHGRKTPLLLNPAILTRVVVVVIFASVTAIPVEMLVFQDVIQGRLNGEVQGVRESARQQLRNDFKKDIEDVANEEGASRKRVKDETPPLVLDEVGTPKLDAKIADLQKQIDQKVIDLREEDAGWRSGEAGQGRKFLRLKDEKAALEGQLTEAKAARSAELEQRANGNQKAQAGAADRHFQELTRISERYEPRKRELEKKMRDVDRLTDDELAKATRKSFRVVDGFARRWKIVNDLENEDPIYATTKWAVRLLFIAFGLLVLTTKALFNRPTRAYYAGRDPLRAYDDEA